MNDPGEPALAATADAAIAACARAWPDVRLDRAAVLACLRRAGADHARDPARGAELCLVWACLTGDPAAQRAIDRMIRAEAGRAVGELREPAWLTDEVHQELAQRLLIARTGAEPRLASYAGHAALGRWLGVAALRTALNLTRRRRGADRQVDPTSAIAAAVSPELAVVRDRYRAEVEAAIRGAFEALDDPRDRNLLRWYYLDRVGLDRLGELFGVHASTVSRWLTALRESIFDGTRQRLAERLGITGAIGELDSLIRAVRSELDLTLSRILG